MEDLMKKLAEASAKLKGSVLEKDDNLDERTKINIELIKRVKMDVSILAQILSGKFSNCNAKLACDVIGDKPGLAFEIMLYGDEEILVHCPNWYSNGKDGWKYLSEVNLKDAKEIAEWLIEISEKEDGIRMELV